VAAGTFTMPPSARGLQSTAASGFPRRTVRNTPPRARAETGSGAPASVVDEVGPSGGAERIAQRPAQAPGGGRGTVTGNGSSPPPSSYTECQRSAQCSTRSSRNGSCPARSQARTPPRATRGRTRRARQSRGSLGLRAGDSARRSSDTLRRGAVADRAPAGSSRESPGACSLPGSRSVATLRQPVIRGPVIRGNAAHAHRQWHRGWGRRRGLRMP